jgi:hypothetical protein
MQASRILADFFRFAASRRRSDAREPRGQSGQRFGQFGNPSNRIASILIALEPRLASSYKSRCGFGYRTTQPSSLVRSPDVRPSDRASQAYLPATLRQTSLGIRRIYKAASRVPSRSSAALAMCRLGT